MTPLQRLCPPARILLLLLVFVWLLFFTHPLSTLLPFAVALIAVFLARGLPLLRRTTPFLLTLIVMSILIWTLLSPGGTALFRLGRLTISAEGLTYALAMALRLAGMMLAGLAFIAATPVEELRLGLCRLGLPYPGAFAIGLSFRLVPVFSTMLQTTIQAQQVRGHILNEGGLLQRFRKYAPLIIPVILLSLRNTDHLAVALSARGYGRPGQRTSVLEQPWGWGDTAVIAIGVVVIGATAAVRWLYPIFGKM